MKIKLQKGLLITIGIIMILSGIGILQSQDKIDEFLKPFGRTPIELVLRDIVIATVAHIKAGDDIPYDIVYGIDEMDLTHVDYNRYGLIDPSLAWDLETNSIWLAEKMRLIVPYFEYENIREIPRFPKGIFLMPYPTNRSFHILGSANIKEGYDVLNERFILEEGRRDLRQLYSTLVHELTHLQEGGFGIDFIKNIELPSTLEPRTQAATLEVLAAWCHYKDEIACKAFWAEIEHYARGSLLMRLRMYGYEEFYDVIADLLWRSKEDTLGRDKSLRHWNENTANQKEYYRIINQYQKMPWEDIVVEGICGKGLRTGFIVERENSSEEHPLYKYQLMQFDDTVSLLGNGLVNMICRMPHGPEVH